MRKIFSMLMIGCICAVFLGCQSQNQENELSEENLYDIYFIKKAPKATEKHDLSEVIKVVSTSSNSSTGDALAIDVQNNIIHIEPWVSGSGVNSLDESGYIDDIDTVLDILEKYNVQDWEEDYSTEENQSTTDDGVGWSLYLQFKDGTIEKHKGSGTAMKSITPEGFDDFFNELNAFVNERLDEK